MASKFALKYGGTFGCLLRLGTGGKRSCLKRGTLWGALSNLPFLISDSMACKCFSWLSRLTWKKYYDNKLVHFSQRPTFFSSLNNASWLQKIMNHIRDLDKLKLVMMVWFEAISNFCCCRSRLKNTACYEVVKNASKIIILLGSVFVNPLHILYNKNLFTWIFCSISLGVTVGSHSSYWGRGSFQKGTLTLPGTPTVGGGGGRTLGNFFFFMAGLSAQLKTAWNKEEN